MGQGLIVWVKRTRGQSTMSICRLQECLHSFRKVVSTDDALDEMFLTRMHLDFKIDKVKRY